MFLRLFVIVCVLVVCSPASATSVDGWAEAAGAGYMAYNWVIYGAESDMSRFATLIPASAHLAGDYTACGWSMTLSRYSDDWKQYLSAPPSGYMWALYERYALGVPPDILMFGLTTSDRFRLGYTQYGMVTGGTATYGPTLAPTADVPEPSSIASLVAMTGLAARRRRH